MSDVTDPYGIDLALTETGDLAVSATGGLVLLDGPENCVQALKGRMRTSEGELPLHPEYGSSLPALIGRKVLDDHLVASHATVDLRTLIEADQRFLAASQIAAAPTTGPATATFVSCTLTLSAGDQLQVDNLADGQVTQILTTDDLDLPVDADVDQFGDGVDFLANDDTELAELADAADLNDFLTPNTTATGG